MKKNPFKLRQWLRENPHAWWTLCILLMFLCYLVPEQFVVTRYTPTQIALDDAIPFLPGFIWFYLLWFPMLFGAGFWLMLRDGEGYRQYIWFMTAEYLISAVFYLCFPNGQDLRPTGMEVTGLSTAVLSWLYGLDTNTNVLPSLHVIGSIGAACAICTTPSIRSKAVKAAMIVLAVLVSFSTVLVKQHAILDVAAGAVMGFVVYFAIRWLRRGKS